MTLQDYQRQFRNLIIGDGTVYNLETEFGLEGFTVRSAARPLPREDGSIPGLHLVESKMAGLIIEIAGDPEDVEPDVKALREAFTPSRDTLGQYRFKNPGQVESFVWARPAGVDRPRTIEGAGGIQRFPTRMKIEDPRLYSVEVFSEMVPEFGSSGGGADMPNEFPFAMTSSEQDLGTAVQAGSRDSWPLIRFQHVSGTVSGVSLENLTTGVTFASTSTIAAGQTLTADMTAVVAAHDFNGALGSPAVHIGGSSRYGEWTPPRDPLALAPGSNTLRFVVSGGGEAACLVTWRSTD